MQPTSQTITIHASCPGERAAGLRSWEETFTINLQYGGWDEETIKILTFEFSKTIKEVLDARYVGPVSQVY